VSDEGPLFQRKLWLREISAMLEGRPLTDWTLPAEPFTTMGS
jgi:hypothetical protein